MCGIHRDHLQRTVRGRAVVAEFGGRPYFSPVGLIELGDGALEDATDVSEPWQKEGE